MRLAAPVSMDALSPRARLDPALGAQSRTDPYWSAMWEGPKSAHWVTRRMAQRHLDAGGNLSHVPRGTPVEGTDVRLRRRHELGVLAALSMWRTVSAEQMGAIVGSTAWVGTHNALPAAGSLLFRAGLVQRGLLGSGHDGIPLLLRPDVRGPFDALSDLLSMRDLLAVSGGIPWASGSQYDRHNLIATELGLRVAQWCPGAAFVVGESLSRVNLVLHADVGAASSRSADATVLRKDGLKIAVEITASTGESAAAKIERWASALVADTSRSMVVLFVEAAHPDGSGTTSTYLRNKIVNAARSGIDTVAARVLERMFVVRWDEWFPAPGKVSPDFATLAVSRLTGDPSGPDGAGTGQGARADLLDPGSVPSGAVDVAAAKASFSAAHGLLGVPYAMRNPARAGELDAVAAALVRRATGLEATPRPPLARPERVRAKVSA